MTKPKTKDPIDPKAVIIEVFNRCGGIEGMTRWGKTHRTAMYTLYGKMLSQPVVAVDASTTVNVADNRRERDQLAATMTDALSRIIAARKMGIEAVGVITDNTGGVTIDNDQSYVSSTIPISEPEPPPRSTPTLVKDALVTPDQPPPPRVVRSEPSFPGLAAGAALDPAADPRSTTEQALDYLGWNRK
jgi:hypothetical protein